MKVAQVKLKSLSPWSPSRYHNTPKLEKESAQAYEERTWRNKCHVTTDGHVFIPPMQFKKALEGSGKMLRMRIVGQGKSEYGKHITAGVLVTEGLVLPQLVENIPGEWYHVNADGRKNSGTRVLRCFPVVQSWEGTVTYYVLDETITKDVLYVHIKESGNFVGIGRFRPANGGFYGRFEVVDLKWNDG